MNEPDETAQRRRRGYSWPRYVVAALILFVILAAAWLSFEIRRTERIRELNSQGTMAPK